MKLSVYPILYVAQKALQRLLYLCSKQYRIEIEAFFEAIRTYNYVVVKLDTPNKHRRFPLNYKIGTDIDVIVLEEDLHKIKDIIITLHKNKALNTVILEGKGNFKIRYQFYKFLNLQFDVTASTMSQLYQDCITHYNLDNGVKVPQVMYEVVLRALAFEAKPKKNHHLEFLKTHQNSIDTSVLKAYNVKPETIKMITDS
jgi:hypothetical protein